MSTFKNFLLCVLLLTIVRSLHAQDSAETYLSNAQHLYKIGQYAEALNDNIKALRIIEKGNNCAKHANAYLQVGRMYYFLHDRKMALQFFYKTRKCVDSCKLDSLKYGALYNIGTMYTEMGNVDSALLYLNRAKAQAQIDNDYAELAKVNAVIADLYIIKVHNLELAKKYIDEAEEQVAKTDDTELKAFVQIKYAIYYRFLKNHALSIVHAKNALLLYEKAGTVEGRMYALYVLGGNLAMNGDTSAYSVYQKLIVLKDSVFKAETSNKIAEYRTLYDIEKKQQENYLLSETNKVNQLEIVSKNKTIIGLCIGILLMIILVMWRISIINLKKKQRELEAQQKIQTERERISRDLHDNVGGQLSYVLFSLEGKEEELAEQRKEKSKHLAAAIRSVTQNLRETIWALNQEKLTFHSFSDKLKLYTRTMFAHTQTKIRFEENITIDSELNPAFALNLFRICQEIINNAFKHAQATELTVMIERKEKIVITISDNGIGFDVHSEKVGEHFGLTNMKKRAVEIGVAISIESEKMKGSKYSLMV